MREEIAGHFYWLADLKGDGETPLPFYMDPALHGGREQSGPSSQEVVRALIARVKFLDSEQPWEGNKRIIAHLRCVIAEFEYRAILRKIEKHDYEIERAAIGPDGHVVLA